MIVYIEPNTGRHFETLPNPWHDTINDRFVCGLNDATYSVYGWTMETQEEPRRFSKLKIIRNLGDNWEAVKSGLVASSLWDEWEASQYLMEDDARFMEGLQIIGQSIPGLDIASVLNNSIWDED